MVHGCLIVLSYPASQDAVKAEVLWSPEDEYNLVLPPEVPPEVSIATKCILSVVCIIIWALLWLYYERQIAQLKVECANRKAEEAEMEKLEKIKEGLEGEN